MAATKDGTTTGPKDEKKDKATSTDGVITAVYRLNLHCPQCASQIKKPLLRTQGVQSADVEIEKGEIKVKGAIDVIKIHKLISKLSQKKVDLISPQVKVSEKEKPSAAASKKPKETQEVHLHCETCEKDLQKKLLKNKGIHSVTTDRKAQTVTVQGTINSDKLLSYIRKKVHKHAEIISSKKVEEEKKKVVKAETKKEEEKKKIVIVKAEEKAEDEKKKVVKAEEKTDDVKDKAKSSDQVITEFKQEVTVEVKSKDGDVPYFVHYVYAPQLFSDENPNACSII